MEFFHAVGRFRPFRLLSCFLLLAQAPAASGADLTVFAASSLADALAEAGRLFQNEPGGFAVRFSFAGSSLLARQIHYGAPADLFLSADRAQMDGLESKGLILGETRRALLSNSLVVIVPADSPLQLNSSSDLLEPTVRRIALADPRAVPAGIYARLYLEKAGVWQAVASKVIPTESVRSALAAVRAGNAQAGIVYGSDLRQARGVRLAYPVPPELLPAIRYPAAILADSPRRASAHLFLDFLQSPAAGAVFRRHGFIVLEGGP